MKYKPGISHSNFPVDWKVAIWFIPTFEWTDENFTTPSTNCLLDDTQAVTATVKIYETCLSGLLFQRYTDI